MSKETYSVYGAKLKILIIILDQNILPLNGAGNRDLPFISKY